MAMNQDTTFYVSPRGSDDNPGSEAAPFASMVRARDAVRRAVAGGAVGEIRVLFREGLYRLNSTVVLDGRDSGNAQLTITYAAYPGERPVFSSGIEVTGWKPLEDPIEGLPGQALGKLWAADLPDACGERIFTLYGEGACLFRARTDGFVPLRPDALIADNRTLCFPRGAVKSWHNLDDVELVIRPSHPWALNILPLAEVDERSCIARTKVAGTYRLVECRHFIDNIRESCWIENVFEGMTRPGCWVLDSSRRRIYLWPTTDEPGRITAPCLAELVRVDNGGEDRPLVANVAFERLCFTQADRVPLTDDHQTTQHEWEIHDCGNALLRLRGTEGCSVNSCSFVNSGGGAVRLDLDCRRNQLTGNTIAQVGGTGIFLGGYGPGWKNANRENRVVGNTIHHVGRITWHAPAILAWHSSANRIAANLIHHTNYTAIVVSGSRPFLFGSRKLHHPNYAHSMREFAPVRRSEVGPAAEWDDFLAATDATDGTSGYKAILERILPFQHVEDNTVEDNEIHHAVEIMGDGNAIYLSDTGKGNIVRGNYIHDLEGNGGQQAIRTDAFVIGAAIRNNIIHRCNGGGINVKHYENDVTNNIVADIRTIVSADRSGRTERLYFGYISMVAVMPRSLLLPDQVVKIERNILLKKEPGQPFYRIGNSDGLFIDEHVSESRVRECDLDRNVYFSAFESDDERHIIRILRALGLERNGIYADPRFFDADSGDFDLPAESPALALGIEPLRRPAVPLHADDPAGTRASGE